jgi:DNA adenine methylase
MTKLVQPLKWFGGKNAHGGKTAKWIIGLMPRHRNYVEPYGGGLAVLLNRDPKDARLWLGDNVPARDRGVSEVVNDLNGDLQCFWKTLRDEPQALRERLAATEFGEGVWEEARGHLAGLPAWGGQADVRRAWALLVFNRQSRQGNMDGFATLSRDRTRGGRNEQVNAWRGALDGLAAVSERLRDVVVLHRPALEVIRQQDDPATLFYLDPPYLHDTRQAKDVYGRFEMSEADHRQLLAALLACKGKVMLSGYPSALYDRELARWAQHSFGVPNHASGARTKGRETEVLWCNF